VRENIVKDPNTIEWQPIEPLGPGAWVKVLSSDPETGAFCGLVKFDPGFNEPEHTHPANHDLFVVEGSLVDTKSNVEYKKGEYLYAEAGEVHGPYSAPNGCILLSSMNGPAF
jgi:2,4'-dihydroxyacetophenone dioxygenase